MKLVRILFASLLLATLAPAQNARLDYYLPAAAGYDATVPRPAEVLGHEVGAWHLRPDQIVDYARRLGEASDRVAFRVYGRTHEQRPLVLMAISSPRNLARLDDIRAQRAGLFDPQAEAPDTATMPLVAWMGYSVHGDESSGASAALLFAYHLAASPDPKLGKLLDESVVLIDPCLNPDGLARFALWANTNRGMKINDDPRHREHRQPWPGGRTNHYWFDLNRDWLLARQPESRARLEIARAWRPNLVTDFHEMGTNSTYFFQPGVRSRMNPLIPARNFDLTAAIAEANAHALDQIGSLYYTQETFDDFYFGKGSTYPDVHGGVGILFEQASSRGHAQKSSFGRIDFPFTIRNQLVTSIASLEGAHARRVELLDYQREFYVSALDAATADPIRAWVFHAPEDRTRAEALVDLLLRHGVHVHQLGEELKDDDRTYPVEGAFIVPSDQPQYRLVKSLFERRREFNDPVFYDVSTWNVLASFDLPHLELDGRRMKTELLGDRVTKITARPGVLKRLATGEPYAFVFAWNAASSARLLVALQDEGLRLMAASKPLQVEIEGRTRRFECGSLVLPIGLQDHDVATLRGLVEEKALACGVEVIELASGLTRDGIDLGSPALRVLKPLRTALLVGRGTSTYEAGHLWHLLDLELGMTVTLIDADGLGASSLADYSHVIAVSGAEGGLGRIKDEITTWVRAGGTLITQRSAARWAARELVGLEEPKLAADDKAPTPGSYAERERFRAESRISGAIFAAELDPTHPLGWGLVRDEIALWRSGGSLMPAPRNALDAPLRYRKDPLPLVSGFAAERIQKRLAGSCAAAVERLGRGVVVRLADNLTFRGVWPGSSRLLVNALFMAPLTERTPGEDDDADDDDESHHSH